MIDRLILRHLLFTEVFARRTLPYLKAEYFERRTDRKLFEAIAGFVDRYNNLPTIEAIAVDIANARGSGLSDDEFKELIHFLEEEAEPQRATDLQFLIDQTEQFCKDRAIHIAVVEAVGIIHDKKKSRGNIPKLLSDALAVSFNLNIGHDFLEDAESRFKEYHQQLKRIPFNIEIFNTITRGGFPAKTLNIWLAGVHVGKTLIMGHCAAGNLMDMKNVLYITMEMSERQISERLDANILRLDLDFVMKQTEEEYLHKIRAVAAKTTGKLIIKEFPTASAGVNHFRALIEELRIKRNFVPDIVYIDYLNICTSVRFKMDATQNSYSYVKAIAEEVRGLAVELNVPIVTATQLNRQGAKSSDPDMTEIAESWGIAATADFMCAAYKTKELQTMNQLGFKQLKNRLGNVAEDEYFYVRVKYSQFLLEEGATNPKPSEPKTEPKRKSTGLRQLPKSKEITSYDFLDNLPDLK